MQTSQHAIVRSQQRGFPSQLIDLILDFGTPERKPGNALEYKLTRRDRNKVRTRLKRQIQDLDKVDGKAVLVIGNTIATVYDIK